MKPPFINYIFGLDDAFSAGVIGSIISAGGSLLGSGINAGMQAGTNYSSRKFSRQMFKKQADYNKAMQERAWKRQDELIASERAYNTPAADLQRRKEAGQNPALAMGGQFGQSVTTASASGTSPDAPVPGNYNPVSPRVVPDLGASAAMGTYYQAKSVGIAQQNADTAKYNSESERLNAEANMTLASINELFTQYRIGAIKEDTFGKQLDNLVKSLTIPQQIATINAAVEGYTLDNLLKGYDLTVLRPAVANRIRMETSLFENKIKLIPYQIDVLKSQKYLNTANMFESQARADLVDSQRLKTDIEIGYVNILTQIARENLSQEEFVTEHQAATYWKDFSLDILGGVTETASLFVPGGSAFYGAMKGASRGVQQLPKKGTYPMQVPQSSGSLVKGPKGDFMPQDQLNSIHFFQNNIDKAQRFKNDPVFMEKVGKYLNW